MDRRNSSPDVDLGASTYQKDFLPSARRVLHNSAAGGAFSAHGPQIPTSTNFNDRELPPGDRTRA